jgi:hypothetical protein
MHFVQIGTNIIPLHLVLFIELRNTINNKMAAARIFEESATTAPLNVGA